MHTKTLLTLGLPALIVGVTMAGTVPVGASAVAGETTAKEARKAAAANASRAEKALAKGDAVAAVAFAELAVSLSPQSAEYRGRLASAYLRAGRFVAARDAYADVLQLSPANGKAALNFALAQIATGDWGAARRTLSDHAATIPAADLGLAVALAGDPSGGAQMLMQAARQPGADAKTRQNLALTLALAGNWTGARIVAQADLSPADLDARLEQWAAFAQPHAAADQVAALLGVTPTSDAGQPVAIALNAAVPVTSPVVAPALVAPSPVPTTVVTAPAAPVAAAAPAPSVAVTSQRVAPFIAAVVFGPPRAVVQPLPTPLLESASTAKVSLLVAEPGAVKIPLTAELAGPVADKGGWYVQLGAFPSAAVARERWRGIVRRHAALAGQAPLGSSAAVRRTNYYRLSVGGFSRSEASRLCRGLRADGGDCFIRRGSGEQLAQWNRLGAPRRRG